MNVSSGMQWGLRKLVVRATTSWAGLFASVFYPSWWESIMLGDLVPMLVWTMGAQHGLSCPRSPV